MASIGIVYGSSTGHTENVAKMLREQLGGKEAVGLFDASNANPEKIAEFEKLILGCSTWGDGELQDDMDAFLGQLGNGFFANKTVAIFGLGDQEEYGDFFVDAIGHIYERVTKDGGKVVGEWSTDGYAFDASIAVKDGKFVGLALDEDNQDDLTEERLSKWVELIKPVLG